MKNTSLILQKQIIDEKNELVVEISEQDQGGTGFNFDSGRN